MASRAEKTRIGSEADAVAKLVQPDVGGVLRTHNQSMVVIDDDGAVLARLLNSIEILQALRMKESPNEHRDPVLARRLASLHHGLGLYRKAVGRPHDALIPLDKERHILEELYEKPPQHDGAWRSGPKPWPQDRRALSICHLTLGEATEAACLGRGARAKLACEHYSTGLRLQLPDQRGNNSLLRARFEELKEKCGWRETPRANPACATSPPRAKRVKVERNRDDDSEVVEGHRQRSSRSFDVELDDVGDVVEQEGWERIELRCAIGRDRLEDPAKLLDCRHGSRCNYDALRAAGSVCPVVGCSAKNRQRLVVRDEGLKKMLGTLSSTAEYAFVSINGDRIKAAETGSTGCEIEEEDPDVKAAAALDVAAIGTTATTGTAMPVASRAISTSQLHPQVTEQAAAMLTVRASPTLAALVAVIKEQLHLSSEATIWHVLSEGERLCCRGEPPPGSLTERASRLVNIIGVQV